MGTKDIVKYWPIVVRVSDADRAIQEFVNDPEVRELIGQYKTIKTTIRKGGGGKDGYPR